MDEGIRGSYPDAKLVAEALEEGYIIVRKADSRISNRSSSLARREKISEADSDPPPRQSPTKNTTNGREDSFDAGKNVRPRCLEHLDSPLGISDFPRDEALQNIKEAIEAYTGSLRKHDEPVPPSIHEEIVTVELNA